MEALMTLVVMGSVAAMAIPLAALLEWWSVRAVLALVGMRSAKHDRNCRGSALARPALSAARN
jgi:hypothetical protein